MTNREKFIQEIDNLLTCENGIHLSTEARSYFDSLKNGKASIGGLTESGEKILAWLKNNETKDCCYFSARAIGEGLFLPPRAISGAAKKLVTDGYLTKEGNNPVTYCINTDGISIRLELK